MLTRPAGHFHTRSKAATGSHGDTGQHKRNGRAIAAYLKAGFRIEKEAVFDIGGGFVMDDYLMSRSVAP